ncbi:Tim44/TimA family putative adaptor protein [Roseivivax sp.]
MNSPILQLLVLAGIAIFLILRLKNVLGTREGFERPRNERQSAPQADRRDFEVIEGGPDPDIVDHVEEGSESAEALAEMKRIEPGFSVGEFLGGARGAYEMILMGYEKGKVEELKPFLSPDVYESFAEGIAHREQQGLTVEAEFVGVRETVLEEATFDKETGEAELTVRYIGELTFAVYDQEGTLVEGSPTKIKRQRDVWTYARRMGSDDPNWQLIATGE